MSVTWNLVSECARRIPVRVFKIHKQSGPATKFTFVAVRENTICAPVALTQRFRPIQRVGVAHNFDAENPWRHQKNAKLFLNLPPTENACHICVFWVLALLFS